MTGYFNTTNATGKPLKEYRKKALNQDEIVLAHFKKVNTSRPSVVREKVLPNSGHSSAGRAITTLTNAGLLRKTDTLVKGKHGHPEHVWEYVDKNQ